MREKHLAEVCAEIEARRAQRALDWRRAVDKLSVTFEADHEGGHPECLKDKTPTERLAVLRSLSFRVKGLFESDYAPPEGPPDIHLCCHLTGGINENLLYLIIERLDYEKSSPVLPGRMTMFIDALYASLEILRGQRVALEHEVERAYRME